MPGAPQNTLLITFLRFDFDGSFPIVSSSIVSAKLRDPRALTFRL